MHDYSNRHISTDQDDWFESCMQLREQAYAEIFGESEPPGQILSPSDPDLAISWPGGGFYCFQPGSACRRTGAHVV